MAEHNRVLKHEVATVDVSSLTNADNEPWDPSEGTGIAEPRSVQVVGFEGADTYTAQWDHTQQAIVFETIADGTQPGAGTDVGEVKLRVDGRR